MQIPTNRIASQNGIILRVLDGQSVSPYRHLHRDDYYGFCLLNKGKIRASIDFQEEVICEHTVGCMLPGQVHQFIEMSDAHGFILFIDGVLLGEENIRAMNKYALRQALLTIDVQREEELLGLVGFITIVVLSVLKPWTSSKSRFTKRNVILLLAGLAFHTEKFTTLYHT